MEPSEERNANKGTKGRVRTFEVNIKVGIKRLARFISVPAWHSREKCRKKIKSAVVGTFAGELGWCRIFLSQIDSHRLEISRYSERCLCEPKVKPRNHGMSAFVQVLFNKVDIFMINLAQNFSTAKRGFIEWRWKVGNFFTTWTLTSQAFANDKRELKVIPFDSISW